MNDAMIKAMAASAAETNRRMKYLDEMDDCVARTVRGHSVPTGVLAEIISEVASRFGVTEMDIIGPSRTRIVATARMAVYHAAAQNGYTCTAIGRAMRRDHSTVLHGMRRYSEIRRAQ